MDNMVRKTLPGSLPGGIRRSTPGENTRQIDHRQARLDEGHRMAKACADFEAIFVQQLFKTMRASVATSGLLDGGRAEELYTSLLDQHVAQEMAHGKGSIGLAEQMKNKLIRYLTLETGAKMK